MNQPDSQPLSLTFDGPAQSKVHICRSIDDINAADWQSLAGSDYPFARYDFLQALEHSGCTNAATGWQPSHLVIHQQGQVTGIIPAFLKNNSRGEYVFDFAWAEAYQRHGQPYYPKLLMAIPFTPSQGPRLLLTPQLREILDSASLHKLLDTATTALGAHSWHLLFPNSADQALLCQPQTPDSSQLHRLGCQFHWHNAGYEAFDNFLALLTSRKRKSIRKERKQVSDQGIEFQRVSGSDISDRVLDGFYVFYQATYLKRGQQPYLNRDFFERLFRQMPEHVHIVIALKQGEMIASALFLSGTDTLYGRYWGCLDEYNHLHFETCYYQGIELAIDLGLQHFDAGAQGEHKLVRGFEPLLTHSWHSIEHPGFRDAIANFVAEEREGVRRYFEESKTLLPFRQTENDKGG
ncbi:GNAT family N-acetyltransferase [Marinobacter sp. BSs20148]|jgi:predicted N-acyltransferase|uniref:GNAT family N-acetyltransferase n=1 Tax=Marinobacter TaxID=2742 RepID=UPI0002777475|nr:GNAT family N-acetyltransferase [Marinobacter sp. BSs20148]AFP31760.1 hypothetical protein MRBBS_2824 [Marinobacter sp. BSs20148]